MWFALTLLSQLQGERTGTSYVLGDLSGESIKLERVGVNCVLVLAGNWIAQFSGDHVTSVTVRAHDGTKLLDQTKISAVSLDQNKTPQETRVAMSATPSGESFPARVYAVHAGVDVTSAFYAGSDCRLSVTDDAVFGHSVGKVVDPYYLELTLAKASKAGCGVIYEANYTCAGFQKTARLKSDDPIAGVVFTCTSARAKAIVSHVQFHDEDQLWIWRNSIVGSTGSATFDDEARQHQLSQFRQLAEQQSQCEESKTSAFAPGYLGEIEPGSIGYDLDGHVFRQAACGHGTNLPMALPHEDASAEDAREMLGMRPCPLNQLIGPVQTSRGYHLLWIHERWYVIAS
jgi:hypothetical protein